MLAPLSLVIDVVVPARDHAASLGPLLHELPHRVLRSVVVVERADWDRWLSAPKLHAIELLRLAPVEVFEHGPEAAEPMGSLF